jgi:hypothetical protein
MPTAAVRSIRLLPACECYEAIPSVTLMATRPTMADLCADSHLANRREKDENDSDAAQRNRRCNDDAPAWRPDDEVPANRREHPQRGDHSDEQEHRERRGS